MNGRLIYLKNVKLSLSIRDKHSKKGLGIGYIPKPTPRPIIYAILGTLPKHVYKSTKQVYN